MESAQPPVIPQSDLAPYIDHVRPTIPNTAIPSWSIRRIGGLHSLQNDRIQRPRGLPCPPTDQKRMAFTERTKGRARRGGGRGSERNIRGNRMALQIVAVDHTYSSPTCSRRCDSCYRGLQNKAIGRVHRAHRDHHSNIAQWLNQDHLLVHRSRDRSGQGRGNTDGQREL